MNEFIIIEREDGQQIDALHKKPDNEQNTTLIIMVHGFPKNKKSSFYELISEKISETGGHTLQFDYSDYNDKEPLTQNFTLGSAKEDLNAVVNWAENEGYKDVAFIAEGLGSPITFLSQPKNTKFSILCWPVFDLSYVYTQQFKAKNHIDDIEVNGYIEHEGVQIGADLLGELRCLDLKPSLNRARAPTLILHGEKDTVIPPSHLDIARAHLNVNRLDITTFDDGENGLDQANHQKACIYYIKEFVRIHSAEL